MSSEQGQEQEPEPAPVVLDAPSVSVRSWIQWLPDGQRTESTLTLVLTTPSGAYVDIRLRRIPIFEPPTSRKTCSLAAPLPLVPLDFVPVDYLKTLQIDEISLGVLKARDIQHGAGVSLEELDWAFSGISVRSTANTSGERRTICTWYHDIDSRQRYPTTENSADTGVMTSQRSSGPYGVMCEWDLEEGAMQNPATGKLQEYKEAWVEAPALVRGVLLYRDENLSEGSEASNNLNAFGLDLVPAKIDTYPRKMHVYNVLHTIPSLSRRSSFQETTGTVIRIGGWCQGILRRGEEFIAERHMARVATDGTGEIHWYKLFRVLKESTSRDLRPNPEHLAKIDNNDGESGEDVTEGGQADGGRPRMGTGGVTGSASITHLLDAGVRAAMMGVGLGMDCAAMKVGQETEGGGVRWRVAEIGTF